MSNISNSTSPLNVGDSSYITASQQQSSQHQVSHQNVKPPMTVEALEDAKRRQENPSTSAQYNPGAVATQKRLQEQYPRDEFRTKRNKILATGGPTQLSRVLPEALALAAKDGRLDDLKELLARDEVDVNALVETEAGKAQRTLLGWASYSGHDHVVRYLLEEHNANPAVANADGETPLHCAAYFGHGTVARTLIQTGKIDLNATESGWTSLHYACGKPGSPARDLVVSGANPHAALANGVTPLALAAQNGHLDIVKFLVQEAGVSPDALVNFSGKSMSVLEIATKNGHGKIAQFLAGKAGATQSISAHTHTVENRQIPPNAYVDWFSGKNEGAKGRPMPSAHLQNVIKFASENPGWRVELSTDDPSAFRNLPSNVEVRHWEEDVDQTNPDERLVRNYIELARSAVPASARDLMSILQLKKGGLYFDVDVRWHGPVKENFIIKDKICLHGSSVRLNSVSNR